MTFDKTKNSKADQLDILVLLRGVASILVVFCHFGYALTEGHVLGGLFRLFDEYGKLGVQIFFVISGFIIPYSLHRGRFNAANYPRFLLKRFIRLQPPYLAALVLTLVIAFLSYRVRHLPFPEDAVSIIKSCFYLHIPADNPVFWTLQVEAQYYIFIGLYFLLLTRYPVLSFFTVVPLLLCLTGTHFAETFTLFNFFSYFAVGIAVYLVYVQQMKPLLGYAAIVALLVFAGFTEGIAPAIFAAIPAACILFYKKGIPAAFHLPGTISYSLYLIHFPVGVKMINLIRPKINLSYSPVLFVVAFVVVFLAAWVFYKLFEVPSEKYSKQIKYK